MAKHFLQGIWVRAPKSSPIQSYPISGTTAEERIAPLPWAKCTVCIKTQSLSVHLPNQEHIYLELQPQPKLFFYPGLDRAEKDWNLIEDSMLSLFVIFTLKLYAEFKFFMFYRKIHFTPHSVSRTGSVGKSSYWDPDSNRICQR